MGIKREMDVLRRTLKKDSDYYFGWQSNIAMSFYDEVKRNKIKFDTLGVNWGCKLRIITENEKAILAHRKGGRDWYAVGKTKYYSPSFMVFKKIGDMISGIGSPEFEYTRGGRKDALKKAKEKFDSIGGEND